jgi:spore coat protein H
LAKEGKPGKKGDHARETTTFFSGSVRSLELVVKSDAVEELKNEPRRYTEVHLIEGGVTHKHVALKLKGAASFRELNDKPAMTLNFDKYKGAERFHGQKKFHLNNGMEDPSLLHEWLCGEVARLCGVPAGRCGHALVRINGEDKGLYLIREGFTKDFLKAHFGNNDGAFFEGALQKEIGDQTEMSDGNEEDKKALEELIAAAREEDPTKRWSRLSALLDVERYAAYLAAEHVLEFNDGYDFGINNYRIYRDEKSGKFCFILHGLDETWRSDEVGLQRTPNSVIGKAFWSVPEGRALYRAKIADFYERVLTKHDWPAKVLARNALVVTVKLPGVVKKLRRQ